jgi:hypothetical protein
MRTEISRGVATTSSMATDPARCCYARFLAGGIQSDSCQLLTEDATDYGSQMPDKKQDFIDQKLQALNNDGVDRPVQTKNIKQDDQN